MSLIKDHLKKLFKTKAGSIKILYGGSANEINSHDILKIRGVDGVLVGGASLDPQKFITIIKSTNAK
jgi:triosephosphate isomerase